MPQEAGIVVSGLYPVLHNMKFYIVLLMLISHSWLANYVNVMELLLYEDQLINIFISCDWRSGLFNQNRFNFLVTTFKISEW